MLRLRKGHPKHPKDVRPGTGFRRIPRVLLRLSPQGQYVDIKKNMPLAISFVRGQSCAWLVATRNIAAGEAPSRTDISKK